MSDLPADLGLTPEQVQTIKRFRDTIDVPAERKEKIDDLTLMRFLRARQWNEDKAKTFIEAAEAWRRDFKVDDLYASFNYTEKSDVAKYYPQYYHKTDKDGRPVYIESLEHFDYKALYNVTTQERQLQHLVVEYEKFLKERLPACSKAVGKTVTTSCTIMDLKNAGVTTFPKVKEYVEKAMHIGQHYYPETMGKFYIINAPWVFTTVWAVVKLWLDPVTLEKIRILGSSYQKELLEQIPPENLPQKYGGTCTCSETQGGCILSDAGPWNAA